MADLSKPSVGLAGARVDLGSATSRRVGFVEALDVIDLVDGGTTQIRFPAGARVSAPAWRPSDDAVLFLGTWPDRTSVCIAFPPFTSAAREISDGTINDLLIESNCGPVLCWDEKGRGLIARRIRQGPVELPAPEPRLRESMGSPRRVAAFRRLLATPGEAALFEDLGRSCLAWLGEDGEVADLRMEGLFRSVQTTASGEYLLVRRLAPPFPTDLPFPLFPHVLEIYDGSGELVRRLDPADRRAERDHAYYSWVPGGPSALLWVEGGSERSPSKVVISRVPFAAPEVIYATNRAIASVYFMDDPDDLLVTEIDPNGVVERRVVSQSGSRPPVVIDSGPYRLMLDGMSGPMRRDGLGTARAVQDGNRVFVVSHEASEGKEHVGLKAVDIRTGESEVLDRQTARPFERRLLGFADVESRSFAVLTGDGDLVVSVVSRGEEREVARLPSDTAGLPQPELLTWVSSGEPTDGVLFLPPRHHDEPPPVFVVLLPYELETMEGSRQPPLNFAPGLHPSAALDVGAAVLVLGVERKESLAEPVLAIQRLSERIRTGADAAAKRFAVSATRLGIAGHSLAASYGALLLTQTTLFRAAVLVSGNYNRSLTPLGFPGQPDSLWEQPDAYRDASALSAANRVRAATLLIHGIEDDTPSTPVTHSQLFYLALQCAGVRSRLVELPHEGHTLYAYESVSHVLAEVGDWVAEHLVGVANADRLSDSRAGV